MPWAHLQVQMNTFQVFPSLSRLLHGKGICCQALGPDMDPWDQLGGRTAQTLKVVL